MRYRTIYRICLLAVILITMIGGIFYYVNYLEEQATVTEGTLVKAQNPGNSEGAIAVMERETVTGAALSA